MPKTYELRCFRAGVEGPPAELPSASRLRYSLDLSDPIALQGLLNRHLYAIAERAGLTREQAHLFYLEVREIDRHGGMTKDAQFAWALPVLPDDVR